MRVWRGRAGCGERGQGVEREGRVWRERAGCGERGQGLLRRWESSGADCESGGDSISGVVDLFHLALHYWRIVCSVLCEVYSVQYTVCSIPCAVYTVQYTVCSIQSAVCHCTFISYSQYSSPHIVLFCTTHTTSYRTACCTAHSVLYCTTHCAAHCTSHCIVHCTVPVFKCILHTRLLGLKLISGWLGL